MTVKELIELLEDFDDDDPVYIGTFTRYVTNYDVIYSMGEVFIEPGRD